MHIFFNLIITSILIFTTSIANARFATLDDSSIEMIVDNADVTVNKNGTFDAVIEMKARILKEQGRNFAANYTVFYKEDAAKVKILEAKTFYKGKEYKLTPEMMEDKPLASSRQGFDQERQILLSFPKAEIGAEIYLKYTYKELKPILQGFYSNKLFFGAGGYLTASHLNLKSHLPLHIKVNDPDNVLEIKKNEDKTGALHNLTVNLTRSICTDVISEAENSTIDEHYLTWISISSLKNWKDLALKFAPTYEKIANQKLPPILNEIVEATKAIDDEEEQINTVMALLNEKIQYMGDWRSVEGQFFPRNLNIIAESHSGDCKEFSTMTVAILRALGHEAYAALVMRGEGIKTFDDGLPLIGAFNHAFVYAKTKSGAVRWLDPTNSRSMSNGVFPDIAGKMALVLDPVNPAYIRAANIDPKHSTAILDKELTITNNSVVNDGHVILKGESALMLTAAKLYFSEKEIADNLFFSLTEQQLDNNDKLAMLLPDLTSRIVKDLKVDFKYRNNGQLFKTNIAPALKITSGWVEALTAAAPDQMSDLVIGPQATLERNTKIKGIKVDKVENLNYQKNTPWVDVYRSCKVVDNDTHINDRIIIKEMFIPKNDLVSEQYHQLKRDLLQNFKNSAVILSE